eukprot:2460243-Amphidinium_carterae.1
MTTSSRTTITTTSCKKHNLDNEALTTISVSKKDAVRSLRLVGSTFPKGRGKCVHAHEPSGSPGQRI